MKRDESYHTLDAIGRADKFNHWMFDAIRPYTRGRVLEMGSGIGNMSTFLLEWYNDVWLSDYNDNYRKLLGDKWNSLAQPRGILPIDLEDQRFDDKFAPMFNSFDTIVATNVVEHVQDHEQAIHNCRKLLKPGGMLVVLVPAGQWLFNSLDKEFGHFRRYSKARLIKLMSNGLTVVHTQYFNFAGIAGWFITGTLLKKRTVPVLEMKAFNKLVPFFKVIDRLLGNRSGLSVIAVAQKTGN